MGENRIEYTVNWDWFYVSEILDEVLWGNMWLEGDIAVFTLEEWRNGPNYRNLLK